MELATYGPLKPGDVVETAPDGTQLVKVATAEVCKKQIRLVEQAKITQKRGEDCTLLCCVLAVLQIGF